ncbi:MAG: hypothetical protein B7Y77_01165, partial [Bradyrhizobium sp. 35-63-5]
GAPWSLDGEGPDSWSCYGLFRHLQKALWRRPTPIVRVPDGADLGWVQRRFDGSEMRRGWRFAPLGPGGIVRARDGAAVLMAGSDTPHHIGIWLAPERGIIHADERAGVAFQTPAELRAAGLPRQRFYEAR